MLLSIENNALDFIVEDEYYEIITETIDLNNLKQILEEKYILEEAEIKLIPNIYKELNEEEKNIFEEFIDKLENNDDVQDIWHNVDI